MFGGFDFRVRGGRAEDLFHTHYNCFSMAMVDKSQLDDGDKILLPVSALHQLTQMEVEYPMLFELRNERLGRVTHCGVSEFTAMEGKCHLPFFMMQNLLVEEGSIISVKNVSLPKAQYIKVRAQSVDFLEISNPRAALEVNLRKYTCLTVGDTIVLQHLGKLHCLDVLEVKPNGAASIVETDVSIDFDEPVGYKESKYAEHERKMEAAKEAASAAATSVSGGVITNVQKARVVAEEDTATVFKPFAGSGHRIDGKATSSAKAAGGGGQAAASSSSSALASTGSTKSSAPSAAPPAPAPAPAPTAPTFQSRIGDKYSKKKSAVSAFTGTGHKLG